MHGAPGSQNGYDNSGHNGSVGWNNDGTNTVADTRSVIQQIANKYAAAHYQDVVVGLEILNEPLASKINGGVEAVMQYYKDGYGDVRTVSDTPVILHDAFQNGSVWDGTLKSSDAQGIVIDHHEYQCFTNEFLDLSAQGHVDKVCSNAAVYASNVDHWVVVGEWSAAMTDCAAALNGYGLGSRWEGNYPGTTSTGRSCGGINFIDTWNQTMKDNTRRYIEAQLDVFEQQTKGWVVCQLRTGSLFKRTGR